MNKWGVERGGGGGGGRDPTVRKRELLVWEGKLLLLIQARTQNQIYFPCEKKLGAGLISRLPWK